jgi:ubiquitin carboxyl-terminal hydrolase 9/24
MPVIDDSTHDETKSTHNDNHLSTHYKLVGIIVHSGQANGGHYYSFVQHKSVETIEHCRQKILFDSFISREEPNVSEYAQWYKFDDTDVSDCKMDDDEEIRSQCFGGDYPAQSFDQPVMKR